MIRKILYTIAVAIRPPSSPTSTSTSMVQLTITFTDGTRLVPNGVFSWMMEDGVLTLEYKTMYAHYPLSTIRCFTVLKRQ